MIKYTTRDLWDEIPVATYLENYVSIEEFEARCKECPNYESSWGCPPFTFEVMDYWNKYQTLQLLAREIVFDSEEREILNRSAEAESEVSSLSMEIFLKEKADLADMLFKKETQIPGSVSLSAGFCHLCNSCTKKDGIPCRYPEKLRYSIEALGGDVGRTISKLMGLELEWMENHKLPSHFVLVSGLLIP